MDLERFCAASRVVIVAGKGGVGKTTVTAALATAAARTGMSVLIVEVEGKSGLATCFGGAPLTYEEAELRPGLRARTLTPDDALLEYLDDQGLARQQLGVAVDQGVPREVDECLSVPDEPLQSKHEVALVQHLQRRPIGIVA
jgi:anion-transporting  ArsA/GET3 family ATPase